MTDVTVRSARAGDHAAFVRLFPELGVDDPILEERQFVADIVPSALIADREDGHSVGYLYFQIMKDTMYIRHVITAPELRRRGVGRALMDAAAGRARAAGCTLWCLNVKPDNVAAIALYERMGLVRAFETRAMKIDWSVVGSASAPDPEGVSARLIGAADDARVEAATKLLPGQLESARATMPDRVLLMLEERGAVVGSAIFHPHFPGAYPFRVTRPELAITLIRAIRPHIRPTDTLLNVVVEEDMATADALAALGAILRMQSLHMKGPLPAAT